MDVLERFQGRGLDRSATGRYHRSVPNSVPDDRRIELRTRTAFLAVELRGSEVYYRLVRNISPSGFSFDDHFPLERPGDEIVMEFPLPGSGSPIRIAGEVVYARPDRGVGVRVTDVDAERYARLIATPPPPPPSTIALRRA